MDKSELFSQFNLIKYGPFGVRAQSMDATISESWSKDVSMWGDCVGHIPNLHLHVIGRLIISEEAKIWFMCIHLRS